MEVNTTSANSNTNSKYSGGEVTSKLNNLIKDDVVFVDDDETNDTNLSTSSSEDTTSNSIDKKSKSLSSTLSTSSIKRDQFSQALICSMSSQSISIDCDSGGSGSSKRNTQSLYSTNINNQKNAINNSQQPIKTHHLEK